MNQWMNRVIASKIYIETFKDVLFLTIAIASIIFISKFAIFIPNNLDILQLKLDVVTLR